MADDHNSLVAEMPKIIKLPIVERLNLAQRRRLEQTKRFLDYDRRIGEGKEMRKTNNRKRIHFNGCVTLLEAVCRDDLTEVRKLLKSGSCNVGLANEDGLTALHECCIDGYEEMTRMLVGEFGANVNARDKEKWTPLHTAALCGRTNICKYLINNHADLLALSSDGNMPYDVCDEDATLDVIESEMAKRDITQDQINELRSKTERKMLHDLQHLWNDRGDLEYRGPNGETPLHVAASNGYVSVAEFLLNKKASVDVVDNDSWQPIHCAAYWRQMTVLELLFTRGADIRAMTLDGRTLLDMCEDEAIQEQILELQDEIESQRKMFDVQVSSLPRRRNSGGGKSPYPAASGSCGSLYNSNMSLSEKQSLSSSYRRLNAVEKEEKMRKKEAQEESRIWTSINSLAEESETESVLDDIPQKDYAEISIPATNYTRLQSADYASKYETISATRNGTPTTYPVVSNGTTPRLTAHQLGVGDNKSEPMKKSCLKKTSLNPSSSILVGTTLADLKKERAAKGSSGKTPGQINSSGLDEGQWRPETGDKAQNKTDIQWRRVSARNEKRCCAIM